MDMPKDYYVKLFDQLLSEELQGASSGASEANIKSGMKRILGCSIRSGIIKGYKSLVLDEALNVHFTITTDMKTDMDLTLYYNQ